MQLHDVIKYQLQRSQKYPWFDDSRSFDERIELLLKEMTPAEKASQLLHTAHAIPRLGIPGYNYWNECLHGVARAGMATVFPQATARAASFDIGLEYRIGCAIAVEARAKNRVARAWSDDESTAIYQGLTFWSPNINLMRDPRWGRGHETFGECPHLTGEMGAAFVKGLQGDDPKYLKVAACAKHFWGHSGPENDRHAFDAKISPRDATQSYLPAFKKLVTEAKVEIVMGAYNRTNGQLCCGSAKYIRQLLRKEWQFAGHFVSDCGAIMDFHQNHKVTANQIDSAALALKNGCNVNCGCAYEKLIEALSLGKITEADLDEALRHALMTRMKLGLFDRDEIVPLAETPMEKVHCQEHRELALESARKGIVLLKNDGILPLPPQDYLTLRGPNLESVRALWGNYNGYSDSMTTVIEGITAIAHPATRIKIRTPMEVSQPQVDIQAFLNCLRDEGADENHPVIFVGGFDETLQGEEGDGNEGAFALPAPQRACLDAMYAANLKVILVIISGSPVDLHIDKEKASAILYTSYPGEAGGTAIAEMLFGKQNPSGRLPFSFPVTEDDLPPIKDYSMQGRTYRYSTKELSYPFGYGLSYSTFKYSSPRWMDSITVAVDIANTSQLAGDEVVQLYMKHVNPPVPSPLVELKAFKRIHIAPGETRTVQLTLNEDDFKLVDDQGKWFSPNDEIELFFGKDSRTPACESLRKQMV